jgi:hypothetical protein
MTYKLLVRIKGVWHEVGFRHMTAADACSEARSSWVGYPSIVIPSGG